MEHTYTGGQAKKTKRKTGKILMLVMRKIRVITGMIHRLVDRRKKRKNGHETQTGGYEKEREKNGHDTQTGG